MSPTLKRRPKHSAVVPRAFIASIRGRSSLSFIFRSGPIRTVTSLIVGDTNLQTMEPAAQAVMSISAKESATRQWFKKRVRPVPATGILSSGHFPKQNEGNFLICNAIGFLGVLQHEVNYDGADITATEIEPILVSSDPNFRPSDVEMGGDGALYVSDWHNTLIGHMQHNMRDPNRDHEHGRIYRVTATGRPLDKPAKMKGKPIAEVCQQFLRSRQRCSLSSSTGTDQPRLC